MPPAALRLRCPLVPAGRRSTDTLGVAQSQGVELASSTWREIVEFTIECEREDDGRWLAEVPQLPGVLSYGPSPDEAMVKAEVLALRVLAERLEHGESRAHPISISVAAV